MSRRNTRPRDCAWVNRELVNTSAYARNEWIERIVERAEREAFRRKKMSLMRRKRCLEDHATT